MKKWFVGMMAGVLAAVMCVSFAACDKKEIDAESIEGKEVTEAQWNAAFDELLSEDAVYTVRGEVIHKLTATEKEQTASCTMKFSGFAVENGKREHLKIEQQIVEYLGDVKEVFRLSDDDLENYMKGDHGDGSLECYSEFHDTNTDYYENDWDTDTWTHYSNTRGGSSVRPSVEDLVAACKDNFALFRYDSEKKGYVASDALANDKNSDYDYLPYAVLKFDENGKLVALYGEKEHEGYGGFIDVKGIQNARFQFTIEYTAEEIVFPTDYVEK